MKRFLAIVLAISISCCSPAAAQRGGRGGAGGQPAGATTAAGENDPGGLKQAIALQATPEQATQCLAMLKDSEAAMAAIRNAEAGLVTGSFDVDSGGLESLVKKARQSNSKFLASLSDAQNSGLKKPIKDLRKADTGVGSDWEALAKQLQSSNAGNSKKEAAAQNLEKAMAKLHAAQADLGAEMGVQMPKAAAPARTQPAAPSAPRSDAQ
ncbi:MAG: hypothetical protein ABSD20_18815 [Terriglobales bacterium]|jgi:hypothetical protein